MESYCFLPSKNIGGNVFRERRRAGVLRVSFCAKRQNRDSEGTKRRIGPFARPRLQQECWLAPCCKREMNKQKTPTQSKDQVKIIVPESEGFPFSRLAFAFSEVKPFSTIGISTLGIVSEVCTEVKTPKESSGWARVQHWPLQGLHASEKVAMWKTCRFVSARQ